MNQALIRAAWRMTPFRRQLKDVYASRANPIYWWRMARACRVLAFRFGLLNSMVRRASVSATDAPIPWYSYPATEFLKQFDFSGKAVFEYGCGNSTLFWSERARRVVSVEHEREWFDQLTRLLPRHCELLYERDAERYVRAIRRSGEPYDVIVLDGQSRLLCAREAISRLNHRGFIILDNSDWFPDTSRVLRDAGLVQIDFFGFGPINDYTSATSLFLRRDCALQPAGDRQPLPGIGSLPNRFDEAFWKE